MKLQTTCILLAVAAMGVAQAAVPAHAAPVVSSISSQSSAGIQPGETVTIAGTLFGNGPSDVVFDDFERGTVGAPINVGLGSALVGNWDSRQGVTSYTDESSVSGSQAFRGDLTTTTSSKVVRDFAPGTSEVYANWWIRIPEIYPGEGNPDGLNWKHVWLLGESTVDDDITMTFLGPSGNIIIASNAGIDSTYTNWGSIGGKVERGDWIRLGFHVKGGETDGSYSLDFLNPRTGERQTYTMEEGRTWGGSTSTPPTQYETLNINAYGRQTPGSVGLFDDVFSASGPYARARIEIGNAPNYNDSTNLSTWGVTNWGDGTIEAISNFGSLDTGEPLYMYVIDANGVPSAGHPIAFTPVVDSGGPLVPATREVLATKDLTVGRYNQSGSVNSVRSDGNLELLSFSSARQSAFIGGFDVSEFASVESATLRLYVIDQNGDANGRISVHAVTMDWDESSTVDEFNLHSSGNVVGGFATVGETVFDGNWTWAGTEGTWIEVDVTEIVSNWVEGVVGSDDLGILLSGGVWNGVIALGSTESTGGLAPHLIVDGMVAQAVPEPSSLGLWSVVVALIGLSRR